MTRLKDREAMIASAAHEHGVDVDASVLVAVIHAAFAPYETMTAGEREFVLSAGAPVRDLRGAAARANFPGVAVRRRQTVAWPAPDTGCLPDTMHPLAVEALMLGTHEELDGLAPATWLATGGDIGIVVWLAESIARR